MRGPTLHSRASWCSLSRFDVGVSLHPLVDRVRDRLRAPTLGRIQDPMTWLGWRTWCAVACALALGCAGDDSDVNDGATSRADDDDTSATATHDDTIAGSSGVTRASVSDSDTSADDSITDSDPSDASSSNGGTDTVADSTTGEELYCGLEDLAGGPWFELGHAGVPLAEGSVLTLECGGQGSLMFFLETRVGGWMPDDDRVYYSVTVDVEGHVGPSGHFFQDTPFGGAHLIQSGYRMPY